MNISALAIFDYNSVANENEFDKLTDSELIFELEILRRQRIDLKRKINDIETLMIGIKEAQTRRVEKLEKQTKFGDDFKKD